MWLIRRIRRGGFLRRRLFIGIRSQRLLLLESGLRLLIRRRSINWRRCLIKRSRGGGSFRSREKEKRGSMRRKPNCSIRN